MTKHFLSCILYGNAATDSKEMIFLKMIKLKDVADIQVGYQARTGILSDISGSYKLLQGKDIRPTDSLLFNGLMAFTPERKPENYLIRQGDILFQSRGIDHYAVHVSIKPEGVMASSSFYILRAKKKTILPHYLAWWLNQKEAQNYFQSQAGKTGISFISIKVLSALPVELPSLDKQEKIGKIIELSKQESELRIKLIEQRNKLVTAACLKSLER